MTVTSSPAASVAPADTASQLLDAMAATPAGHPDRPALRDRAIEAWLPLARHLAHRYSGRGEPTDDLIQTATVGLIKAVDKFDPHRGVDFAGYAIPTIIGEIKRHFRDRTWSIRVPRRLQELRLAITEANSTLTHTLGRSPTVTDIATHLQLTEEEILEGLEGARAYNTTSLSTPISTDGTTELADTLGTTDHQYELAETRVALAPALSTPISADGTTELGDTLGGEDHEYELAETRVALGPALATLDEREQKILTLRFYGNLTQSQIADEIGISQMHVSRLLTKALTKLRTQLAADTI
jgi:RNA polymerase sigma-B factor